jgi:hypothetical protein
LSNTICGSLNLDCKVSKNPYDRSDYQDILKDVESYIYPALASIVESFIKLSGDAKKTIPKDFNGKNFCIYPRLFDVVRAISLDLLRYADFHDISRNVHGKYDICQSMYASFGIKWINKIKPHIYDVFLEQTPSVVTPRSLLEEGVHSDRYKDFVYQRFLFLSNEFFSIFYVDNVFSGMSPKPPQKNLLTILSKGNARVPSKDQIKRVDTFLYSLRYRLNDQDVHTPLLKTVMLYYR